MEPDELAARGVRGVLSLGIRAIFFALLALVRVAVVARFLGPAELGLFGILTTTVEGARSLVNLGARSVLIQRKEIRPEHVGTFWAFSAAECVALALLVLVATPIIGAHENEHRLVSLSVVVVIGLLVGMFANPGRVVAERDGEFPKIALAESIAVVFEFVVVVVASAMLRSALALAIGIGARSVVDVILSYIIFKIPERPKVDREVAKEYMRAGGNLLLVSVGSYLMVYGDNLIVARRLGAEALGLYIAAYRLAEMPFKYVVDISNRVSLAIVSRLQANAARMARSVDLILELELLALWPISILVGLFAPLWIRIVYGAQYRAAADVLTVLGALTFARGVSNSVGPMILAAGRFDVTSRIKILETSAFLGAIVAGTRFGPKGVAVGASAGYLIGAIARAAYVSHRFGFDGRASARIFLTGGVIGLAATVTTGLVAMLLRIGSRASALLPLVFVTTYALGTLMTRGARLRNVVARVRAITAATG